MNEEIRYRIAAKDDIDTLMSIRLEMLHIVNELPEDYSFTDELMECSRQYFLEGSQTTVIALAGDKAVACASISYIDIMPTFSHPTGKRAHLMNVYTKAEYRRNGISRKLVQMLMDEAAKRGVTEISLDATRMGRPLYQSLGFKDSDECMVLKLT